MSSWQKRKQYQLYKFIVSTKIWRKCSKVYYNWKRYRLYYFWFYKSYYGKSKSYYFERVARWMHKYRTPQDNIVDIVNELEKAVVNRKLDEKKIAFSVEFINPRVVKIARALVAKGFSLECFISDDMNKVGDCLGDLESLCKCTKYSSIEELMFFLIHSEAFVVHCFTAWLSCAEVNVLLHQPQLFPKIVVERYDVITGMYTKDVSPYYEDILEQEKYAMENAAGVCFRNFTKEYLEREFQFSYKGACLTFLDYYDKDMEVAMDIGDGDTESLSFCYAGGITTEKKSPGSRYACYLEFAELCKQNKCHFHVYPSIWDDEAYSDYIDLENNNNYFHFHHTVEYRKLGRELGQYDYGVVLTRQHVDEQSERSVYSEGQWIYATANKDFDYLGFGLPIIQKDQTMLIKGFISKGMLIPWSIEQYDFDELRRKKREMKENVLKNRSYYRMDNRIHELIAFYQSL